jgi:hypothetical protein
VVECALLSQEVDGAHHVVEVVGFEQIGDAVLAPRDEVGLDPQAQRGRAHELAVGAQVVGRLLAPEGVVPDLQRLGEAVDVLGDPQLLDPLLRRRGQVALRVLRGEVALRV